MVSDTTGNAVPLGYCYTCLAVGGGISVGSLSVGETPSVGFSLPSEPLPSESLFSEFPPSKSLLSEPPPWGNFSRIEHN